LRRSRKEWDAVWSRSRPPTPEEIRALEQRGNRCEDWNRFRIAAATGLDAISECRFEGRILLTGVSPRIRSSRLRECLVGDAEIENAGLLNRVWVEDQARIAVVGEMSGEADSRYCLGLAIHPGSETGSRSVRLLDGLLVSDCADMAFRTPPEQEALAREFASWLADATTDFGFV
jgi:hypothetical protein